VEIGLTDPILSGVGGASRCTVWKGVFNSFSDLAVIDCCARVLESRPVWTFA
jgi:hypothetical protein